MKSLLWRPCHCPESYSNHLESLLENRKRFSSFSNEGNTNSGKLCNYLLRSPDIHILSLDRYDTYEGVDNTIRTSLCDLTS